MESLAGVVEFNPAKILPANFDILSKGLTDNPYIQEIEGVN
jgi:hypothetical protein